MAEQKPDTELEEPDMRRLKKIVIDLQERVESLENQVKGLQELREPLEKLQNQVKTITDKLKEVKNGEGDEW